MRRALLVWVSTLGGCAGVVHQDARVAVRERAAPVDQAVAIFHGSRICSFILRDPRGQVQDTQERGTARVPVAMARAVPDRPWWLQSSAIGASLLTVVAMPPGRYEVIGYTDVEGWQSGTDTMGRATGRTNCPGRWSRQRHETLIPFEIRAGEVTLLNVPGGKPEDWALQQMRSSIGQIYAPDLRAIVESWKPAILRAEDESHASWLSSLRQRRDGYDLYPGCQGPWNTAVVRGEGTPFPWYGRDDKEVIAAFRARVGVLAPSQHATGFGASCVDRRGAFHVDVSRPEDAQRAARTAGEWMRDEGLEGEIDINVLDIPSLDLGSTTDKEPPLR